MAAPRRGGGTPRRAPRSSGTDRSSRRPERGAPRRPDGRGPRRAAPRRRASPQGSVGQRSPSSRSMAGASSPIVRSAFTRPTKSGRSGAYGAPLPRPPRTSTTRGAPGGKAERPTVRRVDVRRLRVVHPLDAASLGDELEPVRQAGERVEPGLHRVAGDAEQPGAEDRGHGVLAVVAAAQGAVREPVALRRPAAALHPESGRAAHPRLAAGIPRALRRGRAEAEGVERAAGGGRHRERARVAGVRDREVAWLLEREEARLGRGVLVHVAVAVEVIRRDVQDGGDAGPQREEPLELEGGELEHDRLRPAAREDVSRRAASRGCRPRRCAGPARTARRRARWSCSCRSCR